MSRIVKVMTLVVLLITLISAWALCRLSQARSMVLLRIKPGLSSQGQLSPHRRWILDSFARRPQSRRNTLITNLPPKRYNITIEAKGFQKYTQQIKVTMNR